MSIKGLLRRATVVTAAVVTAAVVTAAVALIGGLGLTGVTSAENNHSGYEYKSPTSLSQATSTMLSTTLPAASQPAGSGFVQTCGHGLCLDGQPFVIHGATAYGQYDDPNNEASLAAQNGINVLEIVGFETQYHQLSDAMSPATWTRVDQVIAAAHAHGLHVILNLSSYGKSLMAAGIKPTTYDWNPYLTFIADRINSVTGIKYADDPTIAMVELYDEIDAPNYDVPLRGTTAETTAFFQRTLAEWKALDPNHLVSTGGFSYINDPNSGIDWRTIVSDPNNAVCDVEINSTYDRDISVPELSSYCQSIGKPWFLAAWSSCYRTGPQFDGDLDSFSSDAAMAAHAQDMYSIASDSDPAAPIPASPAVGSDFWNLAATPVKLGSCDIGPQFPLTLGVVSANAPH